MAIRTVTLINQCKSVNLAPAVLAALMISSTPLDAVTSTLLQLTFTSDTPTGAGVNGVRTTIYSWDDANPNNLFDRQGMIDVLSGFYAPGIARGCNTPCKALPVTIV